MVIKVKTQVLAEHEVLIDLLFNHLGGIRGWAHQEIFSTVTRSYSHSPLVFITLVFVIDSTGVNEVRGNVDGVTLSYREFLEDYLEYNGH